eukprot:337391_1
MTTQHHNSKKRKCETTSPSRTSKRKRQKLIIKVPGPTIENNYAQETYATPERPLFEVNNNANEFSVKHRYSTNSPLSPISHIHRLSNDSQFTQLSYVNLLTNKQKKHKLYKSFDGEQSINSEYINNKNKSENNMRCEVCYYNINEDYECNSNEYIESETNILSFECIECKQK